MPVSGASEDPAQIYANGHRHFRKAKCQSITARRITSGELLNQRNELRCVMPTKERLKLYLIRQPFGPPKTSRTFVSA
jgi:hypothetical protein